MAGADYEGEKRRGRMKKRSIYALMLVTALVMAGCGKKEEESTNIFETVSNEAAVVDTEDFADAVTTTETGTSAETGTSTEAGDTEIRKSAMKDGERFNSVIILEGMEETVHYEHIINESIGLEMDYDYESFIRKSEADKEFFISIYDDEGKPENYLEVTRSSDDAETTADIIGKDLSEEYDILRTEMTLDNGKNCIKISGSEAKGGGGTTDYLQSVYIIPASDGCIVATAHMFFEASEGFGRRFAYMVNTIR